MKWELHEIPGWQRWSVEEGYSVSRYFDDPHFYAGINLGEAYLDLGEHLTLEDAIGACEKEEGEKHLGSGI